MSSDVSGVFCGLVPQPVQQEVVWEPVQHSAVRPSCEPGRSEAAAALQVDQSRYPHTGRTQILRGDAETLFMTLMMMFTFKPNTDPVVFVWHHVIFCVCADEEGPDEAAAEGRCSGCFHRKSL